MARAMAIMGGNGAGAAPGDIAPDTAGVQAQIEAQVQGMVLGGGAAALTRPRDFSARFVKARGSD